MSLVDSYIIRRKLQRLDLSLVERYGVERLLTGGVYAFDKENFVCVCLYDIVVDAIDVFGCGNIVAVDAEDDETLTDAGVFYRAVR